MSLRIKCSLNKIITSKNKHFNISNYRVIVQVTQISIINAFFNFFFFKQFEDKSKEIGAYN